jgi:HSP20 family protein
MVASSSLAEGAYNFQRLTDKEVHMKMVEMKKIQSPSGIITESASFLIARMVDWKLTTRSNSWRPPTDIFDTADKIIVRVEIPGMNDAGFNIIIDQSILVISGTRLDACGKRAFHQMEIHFGDFSTEVDINHPIILDEVSAEYKDGFLLVILPKALNEENAPEKE